MMYKSIIAYLPFRRGDAHIIAHKPRKENGDCARGYAGGIRRGCSPRTRGKGNHSLCNPLYGDINTIQIKNKPGSDYIAGRGGQCLQTIAAAEKNVTLQNISSGRKGMPFVRTACLYFLYSQYIGIRRAESHRRSVGRSPTEPPPSDYFSGTTGRPLKPVARSSSVGI